MRPVGCPTLFRWDLFKAWFHNHHLCSGCTELSRHWSVHSFSCILTLPFVCVCVCVCVKSLQLCPTQCYLMDCSLLGSSVQGILQARILEWVVMPSPRGSSQPRDRTQVSCVFHIRGRFFTTEPLGKPQLSSAPHAN